MGSFGKKEEERLRESQGESFRKSFKESSQRALALLHREPLSRASRRRAPQRASQLHQEELQWSFRESCADS